MVGPMLNVDVTMERKEKKSLGLDELVESGSSLDLTINKDYHDPPPPSMINEPFDKITPINHISIGNTRMPLKIRSKRLLSANVQESDKDHSVTSTKVSRVAPSYEQLGSVVTLDLTSEDGICYIELLPPEILRSYIFPYLNGISYTRCRRVCLRWKTIIDEMSHDNIWRRFCRDERPETFRGELKMSPDMTWYHIYRNWQVWNRLRTTPRTYHTLPVERKPIENMQVTSDGTLVVLQQDAIRFYDVRAQRPCPRHQELRGHFLSYEENYRAIVLWGVNKRLLITKRRLPNPQTLRSVIFENIRHFCLDKKTVYFVVGRRVYRCNLCRERLEGEQLPPLCGETSGVDVLGLHVYQGRLYVRTNDFAVRTYHNNAVQIVVPAWSLTNRLGIFGQFFLVSNGDVVYSSDYRMRIHHGARSREIFSFPRVTAVHVYNNVLILGTRCSQVLAYGLKDNDSVIDFDPIDPLFRHSYDGEVPEPIIGVDVVECKHGQYIVVSTKQNAHLIKFQHFH